MKKLSAATVAICIAAAPASAAMGFEAATGEAAERNPEATAGKQPPRLVRGITNRDYPRKIQQRWPAGGAILVRFRVQPNGRAAECEVMRSFGDREADQWTCKLIIERGAFRPAINEHGVAVEAWYGYVQQDARGIDPSLLKPPASR